MGDQHERKMQQLQKRIRAKGGAIFSKDTPEFLRNMLEGYELTDEEEELMEEDRRRILQRKAQTKHNDSDIVGS